MEVTRRRGRRRRKLLDDLKDRREYCHLKEEALDRTTWRNRFGGGSESVVRQNTEWIPWPLQPTLKNHKYQNRLSVNVWCDVTGGQFTGPYPLPRRLTGDIPANVLQHHQSVLLQKGPSEWRTNPYFQSIVKQLLNKQFPNRRIGRGGSHLWPPRSPDLNPFH